MGVQVVDHSAAAGVAQQGHKAALKGAGEDWGESEAEVVVEVVGGVSHTL